ncbi:hypothetical protein E2562_010209 [Oryza meyeriana var. granulata]|uniref:DUF834 domain-containing protein n=1 Tax=Oryza meyeriana var. granulata TaxID=110450 RepID=A0A6G1EIB3_9ORYZ|nr:hypothetical protein E2562_010209 [Oryza meyeriana var. granulata]
MVVVIVATVTPLLEVDEDPYSTPLLQQQGLYGGGRRARANARGIDGNGSTTLEVVAAAAHHAGDTGSRGISGSGAKTHWVHRWEDEWQLWWEEGERYWEV